MINNSQNLEISSNPNQDIINDLQIYSKDEYNNIPKNDKNIDLNKMGNDYQGKDLTINEKVKWHSKKKSFEDGLEKDEIEPKVKKHCSENGIIDGPLTTSNNINFKIQNVSYSINTMKDSNHLTDISKNNKLDDLLPNVPSSSACIANNFNSSSSPAIGKLQDLYPISKGEIHKISEGYPEGERDSLASLTSSSQSATIINCPVSNTYGARLLTKMGWRFGEGLGKDSDGIVKAVRFEMKKDRMGLAAANEICQVKPKKPCVNDKNPVSILMEYCQKNKLSQPIYTDVEEVGPSNMRHFRISVTILNNTYLSPEFYKTKREARAGSALIAAKEMNLL